MAYSAMGSGDVNKYDMGSPSTHIEPPFELEKNFEKFDIFEKLGKNWNFSKWQWGWIYFHLLSITWKERLRRAQNSWEFFGISAGLSFKK